MPELGMQTILFLLRIVTILFPMIKEPEKKQK